jgi:hypothetical protein
MDRRRDPAAPAPGDLVARIERDWADWQRLIDRVGDRLTEPGAAGDWTAKDVVAHVCAYQRFVLGLLGGRVRELPPMPPDVGWDTDRRNAWLHALDRDRPADAVRAEARDVHAQLVEQVRARSAEALRAPLVAWSEWPAWRWVLSATEEHHGEHAPPLRRWLGLPASWF